MAYAFSRDEAMPFSSLRREVNKLEVPDNAEWMSALISFCMALTELIKESTLQNCPASNPSKVP